MTQNPKLAIRSGRACALVRTPVNCPIKASPSIGDYTVLKTPLLGAEGQQASNRDFAKLDVILRFRHHGRHF